MKAYSYLYRRSPDRFCLDRTRFGVHAVFLIIAFSTLVSAAPGLGQQPTSDPDSRGGVTMPGLDVVLPSTPQEAAKDAFVLLSANQERVLGLGYDGLAANDDEVDIEQSTVRRAEVEKARRSVDITSELVARTGHGTTSGFLREMQLTQNMLVGMIEGSGSTTAGGMTASDLVLRFGVAERELGSLIPVSWTERSAILEKYRSLLTDEGSLEAMGLPQGAPDAFEMDRPEMTYEEYQEKQGRYQEWLAEQQRVQDRRRQAETEKRRRQAERRQRQESAGSAETPKVGIREGAGPRPEAPKPDPAMAKAMQQWQIGWSRKSQPLKKSLKSFLALDLERRNQALIRTCQDLFKVSAQLAVDPVLEVPDPQVASALKEALGALEAAADHCLYKRRGEAEAEIEMARGALGRVGQRLHFYGLKF